MSNSIWKMPDQKPDIDKQILVKNDFDYIIYFGKCAVAPENKWAYIDELLAKADKAERLQKAVDVAEEALKYARQRGLDNTATLFAVGTKADKALDEIRQLIKENQ